MLGSLILYLKGMRIMMFQLSGFYYKSVFSQRLRDAVFEGKLLLFPVLLHPKPGKSESWSFE